MDRFVKKRPKEQTNSPALKTHCEGGPCPEALFGGHNLEKLGKPGSLEEIGKTEELAATEPEPALS